MLANFKDLTDPARLRQLFEGVCRLVNQLAYRERQFFLVGLVAVMVGGWFFTIKLPQNFAQSRVKTRLIALDKNLKVLADKARLMRKEQLLVHKKNRTEHDELQREMADLKLGMQVYEGQLIPVAKMSSVLYRMLGEQQGVSLRFLHHGSPVLLGKTRTERLELPLYKTQMTVGLKGPYFAIVGYLKELEQSKWRVFWEEFDYRVTDYPNANISITLHTLSRGHVGSK